MSTHVRPTHLITLPACSAAELLCEGDSTKEVFCEVCVPLCSKSLGRWKANTLLSFVFCV